ncbi:tyrosinase-like [Oculina patagonica]
MKILIILLVITGTLSQVCKEGSVVNDQHGHQRVCRGGKWSIPCRVRREWNGMLPGERYRFINALKEASKRRDYQSLVTTHTNQFGNIHNSRQFLAWHRWYLLQIENILRKVDPIATVPYWDWSLWSGAPWLDQIMSMWSGAPWGFGSNGGGRDGCVYDGPFGKNQFSLTNGGCLKRNFNGNPPDCIAVHKCLRILSHKFTDFELTLRDTLHNNMHCRIGGRGGTMCSRFSANAPEFLLHHAFTDKIWSDWQKKGTSYKNAYFKGTINLYGISPRLRPQNLMDLSKQPGGVCVTYEDPPHENYKLCHDKLASLTIAEIDAIPRQKFTRLSSLEFDLFMAKKREKVKANREMDSLEPKHVLPKNAKMSSQDNKLGFKVEDVKEAIESKKKKKKRGEV